MPVSESVKSQLRSYLRRLSQNRFDRLVTADDVVNFLDRKGIWLNIPDRISLTRSVLSQPRFSAYGERSSRRQEARGRRITTWEAV